ncbi:hypothetical protein O181_054741, partial [Austropuccinia psidii MF-1]|nr:hypothetical protein [Austropuccinia psidii MF-1]
FHSQILHLRFHTPPYSPSTPAGPSRYASNASTPCQPSTTLALLHPHLLKSLRSCSTLKICLQCHPQPPYAFCHPPTPLRRLPSLCSCSSLLPCLQHCLLSLCLCSALPQFLQGRLRCALPTCLQHCPHTSLIHNATYHPYSLAEPSR